LTWFLHKSFIINNKFPITIYYTSLKFDRNDLLLSFAYFIQRTHSSGKQGIQSPNIKERALPGNTVSKTPKSKSAPFQETRNLNQWASPHFTGSNQSASPHWSFVNYLMRIKLKRRLCSSWAAYKFVSINWTFNPEIYISISADEFYMLTSVYILLGRDITQQKQKYSNFQTLGKVEIHGIWYFCYWNWCPYVHHHRSKRNIIARLGQQET